MVWAIMWNMGWGWFWLAGQVDLSHSFYSVNGFLFEIDDFDILCLDHQGNNFIIGLKLQKISQIEFHQFASIKNMRLYLSLASTLITIKIS